MRARCDWCSRVRPVEFLNQPPPEPGKPSQHGAGRCVEAFVETCNLTRKALEAGNCELFACRLPSPSGCIRQFRSNRGRNQHERAHAAKREARADEPELTPEGAAKLAGILSRPGKRIPKLAALLKGRP